MKLLFYLVLGEATMRFPFLNDHNSVLGALDGLEEQHLGKRAALGLHLSTHARRLS